MTFIGRRVSDRHRLEAAIERENISRIGDVAKGKAVSSIDVE